MQYETVTELPPVSRKPRAPRRPLTPHERFARVVRKGCTADPTLWFKWPFSNTAKTKSAYVTKINSGDMPAFEEVGFEASYRSGELYIRYVPSEAAA